MPEAEKNARKAVKAEKISVGAAIVAVAAALIESPEVFRAIALMFKSIFG